MKKEKIYQVVLASAVLLSLLIIISSTELIGDAQSSSQKMTYAYITNCDNTVSVIDTATNNVIATIALDERLKDRQNQLQGIVASSDGTKVYVTTDVYVYVIDTATNTVTAKVYAPLSTEIVINPTGTTVYTLSNRDIEVIDTATNNLTAYVGVERWASGFAITPDGTKIYVMSSTDVSVIDTATNTVTTTVPISSSPESYSGSIAVSPDGTKVYELYDGLLTTIYVIDTTTNKVTAKMKFADHLNGFAVSSDGTKIYAYNYSEFFIVDTATNNVTAKVNIRESIKSVSFIPDGSKMYVANRNSNTVSVIDIATNKVTATVDVGVPPKGIAIAQFRGSPPPAYKVEPTPTEQTQETPIEQTQDTQTEQNQDTQAEQTKDTPTEQTQDTPTEQTQDISKGQTETSSASINLYGEKTKFHKGEEILFKLSAVNLITKPTMHVQVIIIPPSGMSVSSSEFVESGAGQYTTTYDLEPGKGKDVEVRIVANQVGNFNVNGRVVYYFGENKQNAEDYTFNLPIQVEEVSDTPDSQSTPVPTSTSTATHTFNITPGFGVESIMIILLVAFLLKRN